MEGSLLKEGKTCGDVVCSIINGIYGLSSECGGLVSTMVGATAQLFYCCFEKQAEG